MSGPKPRPMTKARFMARVFKCPDGCWLYRGGRHNAGYRSMGTAVPGAGRLAHRGAWVLFIGAIPADKPEVLHICDVRPCVNPSHLFVGTKLDNVADMVAKGRNRSAAQCGERNGRHKLTEHDVEFIRKAFTANPRRGAKVALARRFKVSDRLIGYIVNGRHWRKAA